jgi:hypothetical protein
LRRASDRPPGAAVADAIDAHRLCHHFAEQRAMRAMAADLALEFEAQVALVFRLDPAEAA